MKVVDPLLHIVQLEASRRRRFGVERYAGLASRRLDSAREDLVQHIVSRCCGLAFGLEVHAGQQPGTGVRSAVRRGRSGRGGRVAFTAPAGVGDAGDGCSSLVLVPCLRHSDPSQPTTRAIRENNNFHKNLALSFVLMVPEDALSIAEIARQLRVNPATVRLWINQGRLKAHRASPRPQARWWVDPADLNAMLEQRSNAVGRAGGEIESDYEPGPDEPGLGMLSSIVLDGGKTTRS